MSFLTTIPVIGQFFEQVGDAIDKNITSDHERLQMKAQLMGLYAPILMAVMGAQKYTQEMQVKLANIEAHSEHWLVWARRPIISLLAVGNFLIVPFSGHMDTETAFYFASLTNGLDLGTRGIEKVVGKFKQAERI